MNQSVRHSLRVACSSIPLALAFTAGFGAGNASSTGAPAEVLRARVLEIVNERGDVVGRFAAGTGSDPGSYLTVGSTKTASITLSSTELKGEQTAALRMQNSHADQARKEQVGVVRMSLSGSRTQLSLHSSGQRRDSADPGWESLQLASDAVHGVDPMVLSRNGKEIATFPEKR